MFNKRNKNYAWNSKKLKRFSKYLKDQYRGYKNQQKVQIPQEILKPAVAVCVSVCLYSLSVKASSVCNDVRDILEGTNKQSCAVSIIVGASGKFRPLHFYKCRISTPKTKLQQPTNWRKNDLIYCNQRKDDIY